MGLSTVPVCMPACQRSSLKCLSFPEVPGGPRCPESQDIVPLCQMAQNPQDCTYGVIFTWNDDICIVYRVMWWPFGCGYCQSVCSLHRLSVWSWQVLSLVFCLIYLFVHSWIIQHLIGENHFVNYNQFCLVFLTIYWLALHNHFFKPCMSNS